MGKHKSVQERVKQFPGKGLIVRNNELLCEFCNVSLDHTRKSVVEKHLATQSHLKKAEVPPEKKITAAFQKQKSNEDVWSAMVTAFVAAGIPLHVFENSKLRAWLMENLKTGSALPSERTLRRYLIKEGDADLRKTKEICHDSKVIVMVDETQDFQNRKIINLLIAPAVPNVPFRLLNTEIIEHCTAENVAQFIIRSLHLVNLELNLVMAIVSDNAPYMLAAARTFSALTGRTIHTTCWAHILHLVSEQIRNTLETADTFIAKMKAVLVKASSRRTELLEYLRKNGRPAVLPPTPVITRWTTWLATGNYHFENFSSIKEWIGATEADSAAVEKLKQLVTTSGDKVFGELQIINQIYPSLSTTIKKLESSFVPATDVGLQLQTILALLTSSPVLLESYHKLELYINEKHPSHEFWKQVEFLDPRNYHKFSNLPMDLPPVLKKLAAQNIPLEEMAAYKSISGSFSGNVSFCPVKFWEGYMREMPTLSRVALAIMSIPPTSADVERSFSSFNRFYTPDRNRLTIENIGNHLRLRFNHRTTSSTVNEEMT